MPDPTNDIDALLCMLDPQAGSRPQWKLDEWEATIFGTACVRYHAALSALVAERDKAKSDFSEAWRERTEFAQRIDEADAEIIALKQRVAELEAQPQPSSDLRERDEAMVAWMHEVTGMLCHSRTHSHDAKQELVTRCDAAVAAMRKGVARE